MNDPALQTEAAEAYHTALKAGLRFVAEQNGSGRSGLLTVLEPLLSECCGDVPLGLFEVPLKKIRGTYAAGRSNALSGNFMPLLGEKSEFSAKWRSLYVSALVKGIVEPIRVFEYLGYYYVMEGHKRVSVASVLSHYSLLAEASRLLPPPGGETPEFAVFEEILGGDRKKIIRHMWFLSPGRVTELRELAGGDESLLEDAFMAFRAAYHKQGFHETFPGITTGDAFWQYVKIYGFPGGTEEAVQPRNLARCRPQWELLEHPEPFKTVSDPAGTGSKPRFSVARGTPPPVTFAYRETPRTRFSAEAHEAGLFALRRAFPGLPVTVVDGLPAGLGAYEAMSLAKGNILFATDPSLSGAALRVALERKNTLVLLCHDEPVGVTGTYYAKTEEAAFLMGALAGSLSESARIGWLRPPYDLGGRGRDLQAFAQGASAARPAARVYMAEADGPLGAVLRRWAERGIDTLILPRTAYVARPAVKAFPGVFAHLCTLSRDGTIAEVLAAFAWHWEAFYIKFIRGILEGGIPADQPHYRMGADSGVLGLHLTSRADGARHCLSAYRHALGAGLIVPVDENSPVEVYEG
ncbi:MAG: hypothetical protein LBH95_08945 [Oscillospiraceae bacterium]|jgi:hypothetical protein|nr:hypothetical protein [Oscillospiraceae bacterium]